MIGDQSGTMTDAEWDAEFEAPNAWMTDADREYAANKFEKDRAMAKRMATLRESKTKNTAAPLALKPVDDAGIRAIVQAKYLREMHWPRDRFTRHKKNSWQCRDGVWRG